MLDIIYIYILITYNRPSVVVRDSKHEGQKFLHVFTLLIAGINLLYMSMIFINDSNE